MGNKPCCIAQGTESCGTRRQQQRKEVWMDAGECKDGIGGDHDGGGDGDGGIGAQRDKG